MPDGDRERLKGLFGFAHGLLRAREPTKMTMEDGLGVFREHRVSKLPGVHCDCSDGAWLRIDRQRESKAPQVPEHVAVFLEVEPNDPDRAPALKKAVRLEVSIDEATELEVAGLLDPKDIHPIAEDGVELANRVLVILHVDRCTEVGRDFEAYRAGPWADWAKEERPVRTAISLYKDLYRIHTTLRAADSASWELVWGIGIGRWQRDVHQIEMPLIEQLVEIEMEQDGAISIRPRDLAPTLTLEAFIGAEVEGASRLQTELREDLSRILDGENEFSPFTTIAEPLIATAAIRLSDRGRHITRAELDDGERLPAIGPDLCFSSSWAFFGRQRSGRARIQDIEALQQRINEGAEIPGSMQSYITLQDDGVGADTSEWGLDTAVLGGRKGSQPAAWGAAEPSATPGRIDETADGHRARFFPLPFNAEQAKILDLLDQPDADAVAVSGPPGTGKTHTIANIISHQMAMGRRVLVTARTAEAIGAVREKLPPSLRSLAISSTGTDRESARQLQEAVTALSNEVVGLDSDAALRERDKLEQQIIECEKEIRKAEQDLASVARANLAPITWKGKERTAMDMVELLASEEELHGWFQDRPESEPPAQLAAVLQRLKSELVELAADVEYAGVDVPQPEDLPATAELIAAHEAELTWNSREIVDYSGAPIMARDTANADEIARGALADFEQCMDEISALSEWGRALTSAAIRDSGAGSRASLRQTSVRIAQENGLEAICLVRFDLGDCPIQDLERAAERGAAGRRPAGFSFFGNSLKDAISSVTLAEEQVATPDSWRVVQQACALQRNRNDLECQIMPLIDASLAPAMPAHPWEVAAYLLARREEIAAALDLSERLETLTGLLRKLFPFGLDIDSFIDTLRGEEVAFALRANLPSDYETPKEILRLRELAGDQELPVFAAMRDLARALEMGEDQQQVIKLRGEITNELQRLANLSPRLKALAADLDTVGRSGAPEWEKKLRQNPADAARLIPDSWTDSWNWAVMRARIDRIIELGNGDTFRTRRGDAIKRRQRLFEELIRVRTLLGLARRMTPRVQTAMQAFTQAVARIGAGTGRRAPRFIRAAQKAAREASSAAPVWIMPEYRIPEQLPAELGDFDLVILDEASQSDITALAALARGKKILVVGDEEQVSPSTIGATVERIDALRAQFLDGLPFDNLIDEKTSIFELTRRMQPNNQVLLREHFRCVAPIIQFSARYYNNQLVPLRIPKESERFNPPICDVYIQEGERRGQTNPAEAQWIVDEIAQLVHDPDHAGRDIGVISFIGGEQAEQIERMLIADPRIGTEMIERHRIICGDARTMQGQERSIVFLSMVVSPGKVQAQRIREAHQRANVAMSRACDRLYLVRSVSLDDLRPDDVKADILNHVLDPMPDGRPALGSEIADLQELCDSGFEREVLGMLLEANYRVRPQVPVASFSIDLVVEGAEDRRLAIELDGDAYHGPDRWEADMARQAALERAGWTFWRVFGSQWRAEKELWWQDLIQTLERMGIEPIGAGKIDEVFTQTILVNSEDENENQGEEEEDQSGPQLTLVQDEDQVEKTTAGAVA